MSHHILHVLQHGSILGRERGFITSRVDGQAERRRRSDALMPRMSWRRPI